MIGCAVAIGTFRFWTGGSPKARALVSVAVLVFFAAVPAGLVHLGIPS